MHGLEPFDCWLTSVATHEAASALVRTLLSEKLIACAQLSTIESFFWWQEELQQEPEIRILLKAPKRLQRELLERLKTLHPYQLPAIVHLPAHANDDLVTWIEQVTR